MTGTAVAALPANGDSGQWSETERALVEAAGLVTGPPANRRLAPRPVVEAFLLHARRTGLDPIARQIYCIERGGKWGTQVSIDGARLVAERTGQYRGQTPTQWTDDGERWVDVWLKPTPPAAARIGVYREGFTEPLFAVATFDAYNAGSPIWKKMPALMLGKCAEMLALRKAFPQDLSGLYSTEEMDQAGGGPREVVKQAESAGEIPATVVRSEPQQQDIAPPVASRDWAKDIAAAETLDATSALYKQADAAGELGLKVGLAGDKDDGAAFTVMDLFWARKRELTAVQPTLVDEVPKPAGKRQWVREARGKTTRAEVMALFQEATAAGIPVHVIEEIEAIANTLSDAEPAAPVEGGSWPVARIPQGSEWVEQPDGSYAEQEPYDGGDAA